MGNKFNPFTGLLQKFIEATLTFQGVVTSTAGLPLTGNTAGNVYKVTGTVDSLYMWSIDATSGILTDWKDIGGLASVAWGDITGTLSAQTDLQTALDTKYDEISASYQTLMLLHLDGTDGATATTDETGRHTSITFVNQAQLDTAQQKFGTASLLLDGTGDYITLPDSNDFVIFDNATNVTFDFWVKHNSTSGTQTYFSQRVDGSNQWSLQALGPVGQGVGFSGEGAGQGTIAFQRSDVDIKTDGAWHHIALVSVGTKYALYIDGNQTTYQDVTLTSAINIGAILYIGESTLGGSAMNGWMDDIRITNGNLFGAVPVVGETDTITIPTAPGVVDFGTDNMAVIQQDGTLIRGVKSPLENTINVVIGDGVAVIPTGFVLDYEAGFDFEILSARLLSKESGSIIIDIWKDTYANLPPTNADTITGGAEPTLSSAQKSEDTTLTGWTKTVTQGEWLQFNVDSVTTITQCTLSLKIKRV